MEELNYVVFSNWANLRRFGYEKAAIGLQKGRIKVTILEQVACETEHHALTQIR